MKIKDEHIVAALKVAFGVMLLAVIMLFVFGEFFMPKEDPTQSGDCVLFEADWERVHPNGTREIITLPGQCDAERKEVVRLETVLASDQKGTWLCMRASQQDMRVYVEDELRQEYTTADTRLFGRNSASAFVFFEIKEEDAGKVLAIELTSDCEYAGFLNQVYAGDKYDMVRAFVAECAGVIFVSVYMLIISSVTVFFGAVLRWGYKKRVDVTYLGLAILQISIAMIAESRVRQFFMPNVSVASHVGFLLTILVPYPFIVYVNKLQKGRYEKIYRALSICVALNFWISVFLQLMNVVDLVDSTVVAYALIFVMVILVSATICIDIAKGRIREYGEVVYGLIAMIFASFWELYVTFFPETSHYGGVALSFGLVILLFMAGSKTAREAFVIEKSKQAAIAAGEAKTRFLANMSHEIRTPINTILGMNEMILRESSDEEVLQYAQNVQSAGRLLLGLINDVLDFSKVEAGKMDIIETNYYLAKLLSDVIQGMKMKAESKNLVLKVEIDENLPSVLKGDEIRIRQILNNLLSNAVKYTPKGSVTFGVKGLREENRFMLCMSIADTGIGIKQEDMDKLFSGFQRLEEQKNRYIEGTGLGLSITRQLTELMGGGIEVESEYGKGSCFTVKIPQQIIDNRAMGKPEAAYRRDTLEKQENKAKLYAPNAKMLVVDDNEMNLAVIDALLKRTGMKLTMAHDGLECLEICRKQKFDLILMDHMMPEPDGIETLHLLRKDTENKNKDTEVIVLTANAIAGMEEMYIGEGFSDYLSKPVSGDDLEAMIRKHLPGSVLEA